MRIFLPSSFFSSPYSSSNAQLPNPKYPIILSQTSNRLHTPNKSISMGKTMPSLLLKLTYPKKDRNAVSGRLVICRQLQHRGQQILERLIVVKSKLLAEECPLCREQTLYILILKIVWMTIYAIQAVNAVLSTNPEMPVRLIKAKRLALLRKLAKVAISPKKTITERRVVMANKVVQQIFFLEQLLSRQLYVVFFNQSTSSSNWLLLLQYRTILFFISL